MGWAGKKNGELIALAEKEFDVFVTADKRLPSQQKIPGREIAVIVLDSNRRMDVLGAIARISDAVQAAVAGDVVAVSTANKR